MTEEEPKEKNWFPFDSHSRFREELDVEKQMNKMTEQKPTPEDKLSDEIPCECGSKNHKAGLIIKPWGDLDGIIEDKVKIQIFEGDEISSIVINREKLMKKLEELKGGGK